jgi:7-carboxy-7-deazaguanine synthase
MRIAEIYQSTQGEGFLTGTDSVFLRVSGCNLRCSFCDTPYASWSPEGEDLSVAEILDQVRRFSCRHIVITGGEPLLFAELLPLTKQLAAEDWHITIETAGTLFLPVECDLMSISPKLSNSTPSVEMAGRWHDRHEKTRSAPDVLQELITRYTYQLKFVVGTPNDCAEVETYLSQFSSLDRDRVLLMPQGTSVDQLAAIGVWLEPFCREQGLHFCPRRHIEWFGLTRGT